MKGEYPLRALLRELRLDLACYGGRSARSCVAVVLFDARFRLMASYRIARYMYLRKNRYNWLHRVIKYRQRTRGCNDISPLAVIGARLRLPHPFGIVIGEGSIVEDDVTIYQQVTLGSHGRAGAGRRYPTIRRNARIFAGAKVIGGVTIGASAVIAANSVVTVDVPDSTIVAGVPARIVSE